MTEQRHWTNRLWLELQVAVDWKSLAVNTKTWYAPRIITQNRGVDPTYLSKRDKIDIGLVAYD